MGNNRRVPGLWNSVLARAVSVVGVVAALIGLANCSGDSDEPKARSETATSTTELPNFEGSPTDAFCDPAKEAFAQRTTATAAETRQMFEAIEANEDRLVEHAPAEIEGDVERMMESLGDARKALERVDWDISRLTEKDLSWSRDPEFSSSVDRVFGYYDQVCAGIAPTTLPPASDGQPAAPAPESPGPEPSTVETTAP